MNNVINKAALELAAIENEKYKQWCKENPGYVMHGSSIKAHSLKQASFAESIEELKAMRTTFRIQAKAATGVNGFGWSAAAIDQLLNSISMIDIINEEMDSDQWYMKVKRWFKLQRWLITCSTRKFWDKTFEGYLFKRK